VFSRGNISIYVNGELSCQLLTDKDVRLSNSSPRIYIGAERIAGSSNPYLSSDMLINDIRYYDKAISGEDVKRTFEADMARYRKENVNLTECTDYIPYKDFDPEFKHKLKLTEKYEKDVLPGLLGDKDQPQENVAEVKRVGNQCGLFIGGKQYYPLAMIPSFRDSLSNGAYVAEKANAGARNFAAAGVNLSAVSLHPDYFWLGEGKYDFEKVDALIRGVIKANPRVEILVYAMMMTPPWFRASYPEELEKCVYGNNENTIVSVYGPLGSEKWLKVSGEMLKDLVTHIETSDYAKHVYAYLPGGGQSAEWYWPESVSGGIPGYSTATATTFRKWLKEKYGNDSVLRLAWRNDAVTLENAEVPSPGQRESKETSLFVDPLASSQGSDFRRYMTDYTLKNLTFCAKTIKEASGFKKLVFVYCGYTLPSVSKKLYHSGLLGTGKVFRCPYVDCLITPITYTDRRGGQPGVNVNPFNGTATLCNKQLWMEDDIRTHFCFIPGAGVCTDSLEETLAVIKRDLGLSLTRNLGFWWLLFDNAWFHQEDMMRTVKAIKETADEALTKERASTAEVAFVFDESSLFHVAYTSNKFLQAHAWDTYLNASRMGAPFDFYMLEDMKDGKIPDYKLYIFLNAFYADMATQERIRQKVRKNNAVSVWCYAPGFITPDGFSVESMSEFTGIKLEVVQHGLEARLRITAPDSPIVRFAADPSPSHKMTPAFFVADPAAKTLGVSDGKAVLAVKEFASWRSVYTLMPLSKEILMGLCDYAGVHVYSRSFDVFAANSDYLMLHTSSGGQKTITLPVKRDVAEALTGDVMGKGISEFTESLPAQTTRIYKLTRAK